MNITTKFSTGDKVYFYNKGQINQGKIIHIDISANGGTDIIYSIERKDKQYKDWWKNNGRGYLLHRCEHEEEVGDRFTEDEISDTKEDLLKILRREAFDKYNKELDKINNL